MCIRDRPYAVQAYFIILIKTYIESIPGELVESAEMDGAGPVSYTHL